MKTPEGDEKACWAASLGDCSGKRSREHLISKGIIEAGEFGGLPWCRDKPISVGTGGLTSHVLCSKHNHALSPLDAEAKKVFDFLRDGLQGRYEAPESPGVVDLAVDGLLLERWFLKTAMNFVYAFGAVVDGESNPVESPERDLVEIAWGLRPFEAGAGLFMPACLDQVTSHVAGFTYRGLSRDRVLRGALFRFMQFRFVISWAPLESLEGSDLFACDAELAKCRLHHRVGEIAFGSEIPDQVVGKLTLRWTGDRSTATDLTQPALPRLMFAPTG